MPGSGKVVRGNIKMSPGRVSQSVLQRGVTLTPHKIEWIKCSFLKFSQLRDVVHRIKAPYLLHFKVDMKRKFLFCHMKVHEKQE